MNEQTKEATENGYIVMGNFSYVMSNNITHVTNTMQTQHTENALI